MGIDVKIGLKNGDIIGLAYFTKDMTMKSCNAFKFSVLESKSSPNKSFLTLIENSENNQQNIQAKNKTLSLYLTRVLNLFLISLDQRMPKENVNMN